jgi:CDP-diacylglycerol--glycerol-3-phosphate 3-phosphatidyltransferase
VSIYALKSRFQDLLRPVTVAAAARGVTANQVTLVAAAVSLALGALLASLGTRHTWLFLLLPVWLFLRMALNAIDGMLAREHGQKSKLGAYLNEIGDVVSDAALMLPLALVPPFDPAWVVPAVLLAAISEYAGVLGLMVGASRRYDGPMGKSDRALGIGAVGLWLGLAGSLPQSFEWLMPILAGLLLLTIANRIRAGLAEAAQRPTAE